MPNSHRIVDRTQDGRVIVFHGEKDDLYHRVESADKDEVSGITEVRLVIQDRKHLSYTAQDYDMPLPLCDFGGIVFAAITPAIRSFRC